MSVTLASVGVETQVVSTQAETGTCGSATGPTVRLVEVGAANAGEAEMSGMTPKAIPVTPRATRLRSREMATFFPLSNPVPD
ncbi:hypothetical protein [Streptomyces sp. NPDC002676]